MPLFAFSATPRALPLALTAGAPAFVLLVILLPSWPAGLYYDDGIYMVLGRAIATGEGLSYLNLPGQPAATHYPPLYPALLSLLWHFSESVETASTLARLLNAVLLSVFTGSLAVAVHHLTGVRAHTAAVSAVLAALATPLLAVSLLALSEPLFLALVVPYLWAAERARDAGAPFIRALMAGCLGGLCYLTRSAALPMVAGAAVVYLAEGRWRTLGGFLLGAVPLILSWLIWVALADGTVPDLLGPNYGSYSAWYGATGTMSSHELALRTASINLVRTPESLGALVAPVAIPGLPFVIGVLMLGLTIAGGIQLARTYPIAPLALLGYLGLVLIWPFNPSRFVYTIWPLLVPLLLLGGGSAWPVRWGSMAGIRMSLTLLLGVGYLIAQASALVSGQWDLPHRQAAARLVPTLLWIEEHTRPEALIATGLDPAVYLYTGRRAIPPSTWTSTEYVETVDGPLLSTRIWAMATAFHPDYIIIQHRMNQLHAGIDHLLEHSPGRLKLVATLDDGTRIFKPVFEPRLPP